MQRSLLKVGSLLFGVLVLVLSACDLGLGKGVSVPAPPELRERSLYYAYRYQEEGASYVWGGQDPLPRRIAVDCSGLVIRCYEYACEDFGFRLLFSDTTSKGLASYSIALQQEDLSPGDLIFMGLDGQISHVALFIAIEDESITFIDSTRKDDIDGVSVQSYPTTDARFISYGRLLVLKP